MAITDPRGGQVNTHTYRTKDGVIHEVHTCWGNKRRLEQSYVKDRDALRLVKTKG